MNAGTAEIIASLGNEASKVTTKQIQEALWHYYYDVDKSITYLMNKFIAPPPKAAKKKPKGGQYSFSIYRCVCSRTQSRARWCRARRFRQVYAGNVTRGSPVTEDSGQSFRRHAEGSQLADPGSAGRHPRHFSFEDFFSDMPWLNIPKHRETTFVEPPRPRGGGLLGGSSAPGGKVSKLQALAAARKKKAEEQKSEKAIKETARQVDQLSLDPSASSSAANEPQVVRTLGSSLKRRTTPNQSITRRTPQQEALEAETSSENAAIQPTESVPSLILEEASPPETAAPSAFAQALLGPTTSSNAPTPRNHFPYPYLGLTSSVTDAFSEPSPDDVVLTAQSKGSLSATKRAKA